MPASQLTTLFNTNPYYDDYDENKGFLKALFKPGVAIQARELTQLQSFLQVQLERIGNNVFENGSIVAGGGIADFRSNYVRTSGLTDDELSSLVGVKIFSGDISGRVIETLNKNDTEGSQVIIYTSETAGAFGASSAIETTGDNHPGINFSVNPGSTASGTDAISITVDEGIYYINGYFVKTIKQTVTPFFQDGDERIFKTPSAAVGFRAKNEIITDEADPSLRDPASGFYNHNAPGADRFKIDLDLDFIGFTADIGDASGLSFSNFGDRPFIELIRLVNGAVTKKVKYTDYNEIENTLARRTYDESGNYTVTPPSATPYIHSKFFSPPDDENKFALAISPHRSYVGGYEMDIISPSYMELDKTRDTTKTFNENLNTNLGPYYLVKLDDFDDDNASNENPILGKIVATDNETTAVDLDDHVGLNGVDSYNGPHTGHLWGAYTAGTGDESILCGTFQLKCFGDIVNVDGVSYIKMHVFNYTPISGAETLSPVIIHPIHWLHDSTSPTIYGTEDYGAQPIRLYLKQGNTGGAPEGTDGNGDLVFPVTNNRQLTSNGIVKSGDYNSTIVRKVMLKHTVTSDESGTSVFTFKGEQGFDGSDLPYVSTEDSKYTVFMGNSTDSGVHDSICTILKPNKYNISVSNSIINELVLTTLNNTEENNFSGVEGQVITIVASVKDDSSTRPDGENIYRSLVKNQGKTISITRNESYEENGYLKFYLKDAHLVSVSSIVDLNSGSNSLSMDDVIIDDGQRDDRFMISSVIIPVNSLNGTSEGDYYIQVTYDYYSHSGSGPVTVDSYMNDTSTTYDNIPVYTDPGSGKRRRLSKFIDFRPVAVSNQTLVKKHENDQIYQFFGLPSKTGLESSKLSYEYYLPRVDSVVACDDRTLRIVKGESTEFPKPPSVLGKDMQLFKINMSPYIFDLTDDISVNYVNNQRSTMSDINLNDNKSSLNNISTRQNELISEAISIASSNSEDNPVIDGIFVDDLTGHAFGDCSQESYNVSVDTVSGGIKPIFETVFVPVSTSPGNGLSKSSDGIITHKYFSQPVITQDTTTFYQNLNPYGVKSWMGYLRLEPFGDFRYSLSKTPHVQANTIGENNNRFISGGSNSKYSYGDYTVGKREGMNTVVSESVINWVGRKKNFEYDTSPNPFDREYKKLPKPEFTTYPDRVVRTCQGRIIDESVVPYMKSIGITFYADNMAPGSTAYAFVDNTRVGDPFIVGSTGSVSGHISIDDDVFLSGVKNIRLTDSEENNINLATTSADSNFYAQGSINQTDEYSSLIRPMETRRRSVNDESIMSDILIDQRDASLETVKSYIDPF